MREVEWKEEDKSCPKEYLVECVQVNCCFSMVSQPRKTDIAEGTNDPQNYLSIIQTLSLSLGWPQNYLLIIQTLPLSLGWP